MGKLTAAVLQDYNEYLQTHTGAEAGTKFNISVNDVIVPINVEMFINCILDKIAYTQIFDKRYDNPLSRLISGEIAFGQYVENIRTIAGVKEEDYRVQDFEPDVTNVYQKRKPVVVTEILSINHRKKLMTTLTEKQITTAFTNDASMQSFLNMVVSDMGMQRKAWEFAKEKEALMKGVAKYEYIENEEDYAGFYLKIKNIITNFKDYDNSLYYNKILNPEPIADVSDLYIIMSEDFKNATNVNYLATLFNVDYAELKDNFISIKEFPDKNVKCMIVDKRAINFKNVMNATTELKNPADLTWNLWYHFWRMFEMSDFFGCVAIAVKNSSVVAPTVDKGTGVYSEQQTVTITQGSATNVKYQLDDGELTSVTTSAQVVITKREKDGLTSTLKVTYDGGEDIYRYRILG